MIIPSQKWTYSDKSTASCCEKDHFTCIIIIRISVFIFSYKSFWMLKTSLQFYDVYIFYIILNFVFFQNVMGVIKHRWMKVPIDMKAIPTNSTLIIIKWNGILKQLYVYVLSEFFSAYGVVKYRFFKFYSWL